MHPPLYMLAIDHRWQWEEWCDSSGVDRRRIADIKDLAAEAFLELKRDSEPVRASGALLVDLTYGRSAFEAARCAGAALATPAERAGVFPLEWTAPFAEALPGTFVKVLVRHRSDLSPDVVAAQRDKLLQLQEWCRGAEKILVLEVLVAPGAGDATDFDGGGRPRVLAEYIRNSYAQGLIPQYWKIEGMPDRVSLAVVDEAIRSIEGPRQLILGKGAGMDAIRQWFAAAAGASSAAGFAIGRTVYFQPCADWVCGRLDRASAVAQVAANYSAVIDLWMELVSASGHPTRTTAGSSDPSRTRGAPA